MTRLIILGLVALSLTACGRIQGGLGSLGLGKGASNRSDVEIDNTRFRARTSAERGDRRSFTVTVRPVAVNPEAALEVARYQATRYCLLTYGGSDTDWIIGPDTPPDQLPLDGDTATLSGRCTQR